MPFLLTTILGLVSIATAIPYPSESQDSLQVTEGTAFFGNKNGNSQNNTSLSSDLFVLATGGQVTSTPPAVPPPVVNRE